LTVEDAQQHLSELAVERQREVSKSAKTQTCN
jgi:hypothetical protein